MPARCRCTRCRTRLQIAADTIGDAYGISPTMLFDALHRRDQAASTALGAGFAIPHARWSGIDRPVTVFMRLRSAIPFGAADGFPVTCVLVIVVPKNGADADHLTMLGLISALFSAGEFRIRITAASDVAAAEAAFRTCISTLVQNAHVDQDGGIATHRR